MNDFVEKKPRRKKADNSYLFLYAKYLHSGKAMQEFCREEGIDYLGFLRFSVQWEDSHGSKMVTTCMEKIDRAPKLSKHPNFMPSRAKRLFTELVFDQGPSTHRSINRFPSDPSLKAEIEHPNPETIISKASITFPSGISIEYNEASVKLLILSVILYEEADSWVEL